MFKFAITNEHVTGIINGVAPEQVHNADFAKALGQALNRPLLVKMYPWLVNLIFGKERAPILLEGQRVKSRAGLLGFRYQYPELMGAVKDSVGS